MMILYAKTMLRPKYLSVDRLIKNITLYGRRCNQMAAAKKPAAKKPVAKKPAAKKAAPKKK